MGRCDARNQALPVSKAVGRLQASQDATRVRGGPGSKMAGVGDAPFWTWRGAPTPRYDEIMPSRFLRKALRDFHARFPVRERLRFDPVQFPRRYADPADREVTALLAALLAYGRVGSILAKMEALLAVMGEHPARWMRRARPRAVSAALERWRHRWTRPADVAYLVEGLRRILAERGSLRAAFAEGASPHAPDLRPALIRFVAHFRSVPEEPFYGRAGGGAPLAFLLADPAGGSPVKRWNLFLRWVVRPDDGVDLGLWPEIPTDRLTIPMDTHVRRIAHALGLCRRATPRWETAREITEGLRAVDPHDPVRYDFALAHMGISGACRGYRVEAVCGACRLRAVCTLPRRACA